MRGRNDITEFFRKHDKKIVKLDGLAFRIRYSEHRAIYPYKHLSVSVDLVPVNKHSDYYLKIKKKLGDDWSRDAFSISDKAFVQIVKQLGGKL